MDVKSDVVIDGNMGIGGFTSLGDLSPSIKFKKLTGTTAAEGSKLTLPHNLDSNKILGMSILVQDIGSFRPPNYTHSLGKEFQFYFSGSNIYIWNEPGNSSDIANCPFTILIIYEE